MEETMERRRTEDKWHLRKEIHIAHILTLIGFIGMAISAWNSLDKRIDKESIINQYQDKAFQEHLATVNKTFLGLGQDVKEIRNLLIEEYKQRDKKK